jgi:hypothetical protein
MCSDTTWDEDVNADDAGVEENDADMDDAKLEGFKVRTQNTFEFYGLYRIACCM